LGLLFAMTQYDTLDASPLQPYAGCNVAVEHTALALWMALCTWQFAQLTDDVDGQAAVACDLVDMIVNPPGENGELHRFDSRDDLLDA
jgi:hypothetical protein